MIRRLTSADLPLVFAIQAEVYPPAIRDGEAAFASRITAAPDWCWTVEVEGRPGGYLLSHPWTSMAPPAPDTTLESADGDVWYIHDLSVAPWARGRGLGNRLLEACLAAHPTIRRSELVAVPGAAPFWEARGWRSVALPPVLAARLARYGTGSAYLVRDFG